MTIRPTVALPLLLLCVTWASAEAPLVGSPRITGSAMRPTTSTALDASAGWPDFKHERQASLRVTPGRPSTNESDRVGAISAGRVSGNACCDYDGDGRADVAIYRPTTGGWWILKSSTNFATYSTYGWGLTGDVPVPGDYDGDGRADVAIYRPTTGGWWILKSSTNFATYSTYGWGLTGDVPVSTGTVILYTATAGPIVTSVSPTSGPLAGGTTVTITGSGFTGAMAVKFGTNAASFLFVSATSITAMSPAGSGTVDITVTTPGGTSATGAADQFLYTVSAR